MLPSAKGANADDTGKLVRSTSAGDGAASRRDAEVDGALDGTVRAQTGKGEMRALKVEENVSDDGGGGSERRPKWRAGASTGQKGGEEGSTRNENGTEVREKVVLRSGTRDDEETRKIIEADGREWRKMTPTPAMEATAAEVARRNRTAGPRCGKEEAARFEARRRAFVLADSVMESLNEHTKSSGGPSGQDARSTRDRDETLQARGGMRRRKKCAKRYQTGEGGGGIGLCTRGERENSEERARREHRANQRVAESGRVTPASRAATPPNCR
ncbi:hypothetical protein B0H11DRAFT_1915250 [Mycena galericulata]|nr:hypothetical protein B0H11DRAFT_1915250 [Mycena galericulata]